MAVIFGAKSDKSNIFKAGEATCTIDNVDAILLQVDISIDRSLQPIPTLGHGIQWSASQPQGTLQASSILTKSADLVERLGGDDSICTKRSIQVDMRGAQCGTAASKKIKINDAYCSRISFSLSGQQGYIGTGLVIQFTSCEIV